jgi:hypothetical protein
MYCLGSYCSFQVARGDRAGRLKFINDRSGHYRPPPQFIEQALDRLQQLLPPGTIESLRKNNKILIGGYPQ